MKLYFENEVPGIGLEERIPGGCAAAAEKIAELVLREEGCPWEGEVSLLVTDDAAIREINAAQRGIDAATDVLSFPANEFPAPGDFAGLEKTEGFSFSFDRDSSCLMLGDIVISADHVLAQAEEYGHAVRREFCFLVAHSMLHLIGYDHMTPEDEKVMFARQEELLAKSGITREAE